MSHGPRSKKPKSTVKLKGTKSQQLFMTGILTDDSEGYSIVYNVNVCYTLCRTGQLRLTSVTTNSKSPIRIYSHHRDLWSQARNLIHKH